MLVMCIHMYIGMYVCISNYNACINAGNLSHCCELERSLELHEFREFALGREIGTVIQYSCPSMGK